MTRPGEAEAVEALARGIFGGDDRIWQTDPGGECERHRQAVRRGLAAAYPVIAEAVRADERERIAQAIAGSVRYGAEMYYDGSEDPGMAAYIEGLRHAHDIARGVPR